MSFTTNWSSQSIKFRNLESESSEDTVTRGRGDQHLRGGGECHRRKKVPKSKTHTNHHAVVPFRDDELNIWLRCFVGSLVRQVSW